MLPSPPLPSSLLHGRVQFPIYLFKAVCMTRPLGCLAWAEAMAARKANYRFFEHLRTITACVVFHDWEQLLGSITDAAIRPP